MKFDQEKNFRDWMKFLDAGEVKFQLISASLYLTAYDLLIQCIVEKIKDFYTTGFDEKGWIVDRSYENDVRGLFKKDIVIASLLWLKKNEAITEKEFQRIKTFKGHRNEIAHELTKIITDSDASTKTEFISEIRDLFFKIQKWWFVEFEVPIDPELGKLDMEKLDFNAVLALIMLPMDYMVNIVNDEIKKKQNAKASRQ